MESIFHVLQVYHEKVLQCNVSGYPSPSIYWLTPHGVFPASAVLEAIDYVVRERGIEQVQLGELDFFHGKLTATGGMHSDTEGQVDRFYKRLQARQEYIDDQQSKAAARVDRQAGPAGSAAARDRPRLQSR